MRRKSSCDALQRFVKSWRNSFLHGEIDHRSHCRPNFRAGIHIFRAAQKLMLTLHALTVHKLKCCLKPRRCASLLKLGGIHRPIIKPNPTSQECGGCVVYIDQLLHQSHETRLDSRKRPQRSTSLSPFQKVCPFLLSDVRLKKRPLRVWMSFPVYEL